MSCVWEGGFMRIHPFIASAALMLAGVIAFGATVIVHRHERRTRRSAPPPEAEDAPLSPPRHVFPAAFVPRRAPPPAPAPPPTGALRVRVTGPHGLLVADAEITARVHAAPRKAGDDGDEMLVEDDEAAGQFAADGLEPGLYDLEVTAPGMRTGVVEGVATGGELVNVSLARRPVLRGAVGDVARGPCQNVRVTVTPTLAQGEDAAESSSELDVDEDCTFLLDGAPERGPLTIVARGPGFVERALVTVPAEGDPAFVCLRPPCAEPTSVVAVYVTDAQGRPLDESSLDWVAGQGLEGEAGSWFGGGLALLRGRRAGERLELRASGDGHASATTELLVGAGVTEVVLTLPSGRSEPSAERGEAMPNETMLDEVTPPEVPRNRLADAEDDRRPSRASVRAHVLLLR